jgi:hypothetical protein
MFAKDKHVSLFNRNISDEEEKLYTAATPVTQPSMKRILKKQINLAKIEKKNVFTLFNFFLSSPLPKIQSTGTNALPRSLYFGKGPTSSKKVLLLR